MTNIDRILQRHLPATAAPGAAATTTAQVAAAEPSTSADVEDVEDLGSWGLLRGVRDRAVSLELRKRDDTVLAIPYALIEQFAFDPSDGITLRAVGREVRIKGRHLNGTDALRPLSLFTALARQRVTWVREASRDAGPARASSTVIESIAW